MPSCRISESLARTLDNVLAAAEAAKRLDETQQVLIRLVSGRR